MKCCAPSENRHTLNACDETTYSSLLNNLFIAVYFIMTWCQCLALLEYMQTHETSTWIRVSCIGSLHNSSSLFDVKFVYYWFYMRLTICIRVSLLEHSLRVFVCMFVRCCYFFVQSLYFNASKVVFSDSIFSDLLLLLLTLFVY